MVAVESARPLIHPAWPRQHRLYAQAVCYLVWNLRLTKYLDKAVCK